MANPTITPTQPFIHGSTRYEPGQEYEVTPAEASLFVHAGWATSPTVSTKLPQEVLREPADLDVHDSDTTSD